MRVYTELIIIKTFINIWHLFQPFIVRRNILPLIRKVEWGLQFHKKISICCVSILGAFKSVEKKKVSHNDITSYCHQHIVCNYGGGGEPQVPLSSFLTAAAYLFCFLFVSFPFHLYKKFEELSPIYIFCYGHKNAGLESAFVRKLQYCSLSSFFFSLFFISLGTKEQGKASSVLSLQLPSIAALWRWRTNNYMVVVGSFDWAAG